MVALSRIAVVFTGGTISMVVDPFVIELVPVWSTNLSRKRWFVDPRW